MRPVVWTRIERDDTVLTTVVGLVIPELAPMVGLLVDSLKPIAVLELNVLVLGWGRRSAVLERNVDFFGRVEHLIRRAGGRGELTELWEDALRNGL